MNWHALTIVAPLVVLVGCTSTYPKPDVSTQNNIAQEMRQAGETKPAVKTPATGVSAEILSDLMMPSINSLIPKSGRGTVDQRFDLVVNDAPIGQVLSGLVAGTEYSILLKPAAGALPMPGAAGGTISKEIMPSAETSASRVTLNLKNVTLTDALNAIRDVYGYDYTIDGHRILVQAAELQTRLYYVNYILGQRRGVSDLQVIGGASVGHTSSTSTSSSSTSSSNYASVQASGLSTSVKSDIWGEAEDALRTVLGCNIAKSVATPATSRVGGTSTAQGNASRADISQLGESTRGDRLHGIDGCVQGRALTINQMSGTILARGMPTELRMVEKLLRSMQLSISRQVIIESKIIDVELSNDSQQGINWGAFQNGMHQFSVGASTGSIGMNQPNVGAVGGTISSTVTLGGLLGATLATGASAPNAFSSGLGMAFQARNFAALINFLESQGRVHVLSSPRIATLNNQKAVIKVGSEEPFVTNITGGSISVPSAGSNAITIDPTLTYQPFFSGISLDVTPQIDADDNITLHVHSMVNSVVEKSKLALPNSDRTVPFAVNTLNETDSVVKAKDGQVIVIGGLMTEKTSDNRGGIPGARDVPGVGALFNRGAQSSTKRELVIMLKTTVVKDDSVWANDIAATGERIGARNTPAPR